MVVPTIAVPNIHIPPQPSGAEYAGVPSETSILARLPFRAVPATVSTPEVYNNDRVYPPLRDPESVAVKDAPQKAAVLPPHLRSLRQAGAEHTQNAVSFTTLFMTQVMAQGGERDLVATFLNTPKTPALDKDVMDALSLVKFYPSMAAMPDPAPTGTRAISEAGIQENRIKQSQAASAPVSTPPVSTPPVSTPPSGVSARDINPPAETLVGRIVENTPMPDPEELAYQPDEVPPAAQPRIRLGGSLIRPAGTEAYDATFSRNLLNLDQSESPSEPIRLTV